MRKVIPIASNKGAGSMPSSAHSDVVHVVQHTSAEYLGLIEDHLEGRGIRFRYCRPFTGKVPLPRADALGRGLVLLGGGPWGAAGGRDVPTLEDEVALARAALEKDTPVLGIGLGAQILALASGGKPEAGGLEFSIGTARRTHEQALGGYLPAEYPLAIYMRDWPAPPPGAKVLAADQRGRAALWQLGERALGFAGHPGLKVAMVEDLVMEFEDVPGGVEAGLAALRGAQRALEDALVPLMAGVVRVMRWMD
jgi:GMP synthase-like glutamine amidotransferase